MCNKYTHNYYSKYAGCQEQKWERLIDNLSHLITTTCFVYFFKYSSIAASNFSMSAIWISPICAMRKVVSLMGP